MFFTLDNLNPVHFWPELPLITKLFVLFLLVVIIYSTYKLLRIIVRLRLLRSPHGSSASAISSLTTLQNKAGNLRQLNLFTFYLFTFCFLLQTPAIFTTFGDSKIPGFTLILMQLATHLEYATDVSLALLFLHSIQWFVSSRLAVVARELPH